MKTNLIALLVLLAGYGLLSPVMMQGQAPTDRYRRISLCNILIKHDKEKYADEIEQQFLKIPVSDKYNDHNLSVRVVTSSDKKLKDNSDVDAFVKNNMVGSRLVGKWFNRNILDGSCNMELVKQRGVYDATAFDRELASRSARGESMLADAGEDLIGRTYLLMHEITYVDKSKRSRVWGAIGQSLMIAAAAYTGNTDLIKTGEQLNDIISSMKGFTVKINTRLYRLVWDDDIAGTFYTQYYTESPNIEVTHLFERHRDAFKMEYVGNVVSNGGTSSFLGINEDEPYMMIRKACQRAIDENIADLQKKYEQFRIKAPVVTVTPTITASMGLKEGVTKDSRYEVLETQIKDGKTIYKRVGVVKPVPSKIWDNRFMAVEEGAPGADLGATTFVKESGGDIIPGMLIRELN